MKHTIKFYVERDDDELGLVIIATISPYIPAVIHLPPERCSPAEGGEVEIQSITLNGNTWDGELTEAEQAKAEEELFEATMRDRGSELADYGHDEDYYIKHYR